MRLRVAVLGIACAVLGCSGGESKVVGAPGPSDGPAAVDAADVSDRSVDGPSAGADGPPPAADVLGGDRAVDGPAADLARDAPLPDVQVMADVSAATDAPVPDAAAPDAKPSVDAAPMCQGPISCSGPSSSAGCDPVCQTGCGCNQRCTLGATGTACQAATQPALEPSAACDADDDRCRAGSVCLPESSVACGAHCYRYCRADSDCGGPGRGRCLGEAQFGMVSHAICSRPIETCDPTGQARCVSPGMANANFGCYILSARFPDETVCECAGSLQENQVCAFEHECRPGLECVKLVGSDPRCRRVCRLDAPNSTCAGGQVCTAFSPAPPGARFGYCR